MPTRSAAASPTTAGPWNSAASISVAEARFPTTSSSIQAPSKRRRRQGRPAPDVRRRRAGDDRAAPLGHPPGRRADRGRPHHLVGYQPHRPPDRGRHRQWRVPYDGDTGEQVAEIPGDDDRGVYITVADQLFATTYGGDVTQYDLESLEPIRTFGGSRGYVQHIHGTADGSVVVTGGGDRAVTIFDVATGTRWGHRSSSTPTSGTSSRSPSTDAHSLSAAASDVRAYRSGISIRRGGKRARARSPAAT